MTGAGPLRCTLTGDEQLRAAAFRALARVNRVAADDDRFAGVWQDAVRAVADQVTARMAGAWMAGRQRECVRGQARVPVPADVPRDQVKLAFTLAVTDEVARRLAAMPAPGAFG